MRFFLLKISFFIVVGISIGSAQQVPVQVSVNLAMQPAARLNLLLNNFRNINDGDVVSRMTIVNQVAFYLVVMSDAKIVDRDSLLVVNAMESEMGGFLVTSPIYFKDEQVHVEELIMAGNELSWRPELFASYTRKIRDNCVKRGQEVPAYSGKLHLKM